MLAVALPPVVDANLRWFVSGLIVVLGLFVYGFRDLLRTSLGRIWAISGVCFRDAIRRKVLWITPLAMLGILVIAGLQKPVDEQDAIRLTIKFCFMTTALVVTIIAIITAATNLPREIENRVVYTIVTKPVTRLEIVLGKIVGFARVSAAILIIMGVFSIGYLHIQAWYLGRNIKVALQAASIDPARRDWLMHYQEQGLLYSQTIDYADSMMQFAKLPASKDDRWIAGGIQDAIVPFQLNDKDLAVASAPDQPEGSGGAGLLLHIPYEHVGAPDPKAQQPQIAVQILDARTNVVIPGNALMKDPAIALTDPSGKQPVLVQLAPDKAMMLAQARRFFVQVICMSSDTLYNFQPSAVLLIAPDSDTKTRTIQPLNPPILRGSSGRSGQQLRGPEHGIQPVQVFSFHDSVKPHILNGHVPFELNVPIERSGADADSEIATTVEVRVRSGDKVSPPVLVYPENRTTVFFDLPADYVTSGDFDVLIRNKTTGHVLSMDNSVLSLVGGREYFGVNLFKGLTVLWLFTILTSVAALCCSTFLSWPIAVVLTVLIMLGRWGVSNLDLGTGLGAQIANEFFQNNSATATVVNRSVEGLTHALTLFASVLPNIEPFGVSEQIERGVTISFTQLGEPLAMLALFGLPLLTASYVFLRNKEVAP